MPWCPAGCHHRGQCSRGGRCRCDPPYEGAACQHLRPSWAMVLGPLPDRTIPLSELSLGPPPPSSTAPPPPPTDTQPSQSPSSPDGHVPPRAPPERPCLSRAPPTPPTGPHAPHPAQPPQPEPRPSPPPSWAATSGAATPMARGLSAQGSPETSLQRVSDADQDRPPDGTVQPARGLDKADSDAWADEHASDPIYCPMACGATARRGLCRDGTCFCAPGWAGVACHLPLSASARGSM